MKNFRIVAIITAIIGLGVSSYLTWAKLTHQNVVCINNLSDCNIVNSSSYSEWQGIPVALIGMIGYFLIIVLFTVYKDNNTITRYIPLLLFGITLFGIVYSLYLTYLELFVIHALCQWCLVSALAMIVLFVLSAIFLGKTKIIGTIL